MNPINQWGVQGIGNGQFNSPEAIAVDENGTVYVADSGNDRIQVFDNHGTFIRQWGGVGSANGQFQYPVGVAVGPASVYVVDSDNDRVQVFDRQGNFGSQFGTAGMGGSGTFKSPWGIALDTAGRIYVTDNQAWLVQVFSSTGTFVTQWDPTQGSPLLSSEKSVGVDGNGLVYVTDGFGAVGFFDGNGNLLGSNQAVSVNQGTTLTFNSPEGIAVSGGNWVVADSGNGLLEKFGVCPIADTPTVINTSTFTATITPTPSPIPTPLSNVWSQATDSASFSPRGNQAGVFYNNQLWMIGGQDASGPKNDVWYSPDGVDWKLTTSKADFGVRYGHQAVVYNNKMWVVGGYDGSHFENDVWYSTNGINWSAATTQAAFAGRYGHECIVFNDGSGSKLWVIGGRTNAGLTNDVWNSSDGINWTQVAPSGGATFAPRADFGCVAFNNKLWVMGGSPSGEISDVWSSSNGAVWTPARSSQVFGGPSWMTGLVYGSQMLAVGGNGSSNGFWSSSDGTNWTAASPAPAFVPRTGNTTLATTGQIWTVGGISASSSYLNDVWYSPPLPTPTFTMTLINTPTVTGTVTPFITPTPTPTSISSVWRVNAGGGRVSDSMGNIWNADQNYGGTNLFTNQTISPISGAVTADQPLYQTNRSGDQVLYAFNVPDGNYQVTLKFAEIKNMPIDNNCACGFRIFKVLINNQLELASFDIVVDAGSASNKADDKVFDNITPGGAGQIVVQLSKGPADQPIISAIQIIPEPLTFTPTATVTATPTITKTPTVTSTPTTDANAGKTWALANGNAVSQKAYLASVVFDDGTGSKIWALGEARTITFGNQRTVSIGVGLSPIWPRRPHPRFRPLGPGSTPVRLSTREKSG